jgi:mycothiol synthase
VTLEFREPAPGDEEAVSGLVAAFDAAFLAELEPLSVQDVREWWQFEDEVRLVLEDGALVGFASLRQRKDRYDALGFVHPAAFGRGVGTRIVEWAEERSLGLGGTEVRISVTSTDERAACLLRSRGYERIRSFFRMVIELDEEPAPVEWPEGFEVSALSPGEEHVLHEVLQDAFRDHWEHTPWTFEEWIGKRTLEHDLCFLVHTGGEVAAAAECRRERFGMGWVGTLGTRRKYRRRGLGDALLRHSLRELYARGARKVGLGVDAESPTGATRLYERAGMRAAWRSDVYARTLQVP